MTRTIMAHNKAMRLTVDVRGAVAMLTGASDVAFSTVTASAAKLEQQCAVAEVTKVIAVCCP